MVTFIRGSIVVVVGALLLALPMVSGAVLVRFHNQTYTCYQVNCSDSNPNGEPACKNVPNEADISYIIGAKTLTDTDISINRAVEICVPSNVSVQKTLFNTTGWTWNSWACYNIPELQRTDVNQPLSVQTIYNKETTDARVQREVCFPAVTQDCPDFFTKGTCPTPPNK
jgi:hypothetical protein